MCPAAVIGRNAAAVMQMEGNNLAPSVHVVSVMIMMLLLRLLCTQASKWLLFRRAC
jgi:hypothetical protein